ncbi:sphingosine kinase 2 [Amia ocellicauda]|uniref:sphingosine kinase 2 n=1 Tax=Amia ocellicauda TaxID=2972642 RepID=UPI003464B1FD
MRSPEAPPSEALLHAQFWGWGGGGGVHTEPSDDPGPPDPAPPPVPPAGPSAAPSYALTLTSEHLHVQRLQPRPGRDARLLVPLSELVGCQCPRAPAPPLLLLFWYPPPRRRQGGARRRQVRAFLAEARPEAERWAVAVQCLLAGVPVSASTEFCRSLLPRPRRLLLLVNPFSGRGQAMQLCQSHILPMIREAGISYNLIQTERQYHARDLVREISLPEWDGIVIVSGDGLLHEVVNGLMSRPDWREAIRTPLGVLPCGSGNALAGALNHLAGFDMCLRESLLLNCCFLLCRGGVRPMDLVSVTTSSGSSAPLPPPPPASDRPRSGSLSGLKFRPVSRKKLSKKPQETANGRGDECERNGTPAGAPAPSPAPLPRLFSFLSVAWGFVSDVDIESERFRSLGSVRFTLGTLVRLASLRTYRGRLSYLPPSAATAAPSSGHAFAAPPPRPLSRSITEGLGGFFHQPLSRTVSDMGLSEQRSLGRERAREEREQGRGAGKGQRERQRARETKRRREREQQERQEREERERGGRRRRESRDAGVVRTSSLAEDKEGEAEGEREGALGVANQSAQGGAAPATPPPAPNSPEAVKLTAGGEPECGRTVPPQEDEEVEEDEARSPLSPSLSVATPEITLSPPVAAPSHPALSLSLSLPFPLSSCDSLPPPPAPATATTDSPSPSPSLRSPSPSFTFDLPEPHAHPHRSPPSPSPPAPCPAPAHPDPTPPEPHRPPLPRALSPSTPDPPPPAPLRRPKVPSPPPTDSLLPPLDQPLPPQGWVSVEGEFVLVLALYQTHLGADLLASPQAAPDDGLIHLTLVRGGISRAALLRLLLAMERGAAPAPSAACPYPAPPSPFVSYLPAVAFRLQPLSARGTLTVDGELVPYGPLQAQVHPSMARVIVGDSAVRVTRF